MSVGLSGFTARAQELEPTDVARRALRLAWGARWRIWPYVAALLVVEAAARVVADRYGFAQGGGYGIHGAFHGVDLSDFMRQASFTAARAVAMAVVCGMLLREMLGYAGPAWRPDRGLVGFVALNLVAAAAPIAAFAPAAFAWELGGDGRIVLVAAAGIGGLGALCALLFIYLRLLLWPIGVAVGDEAMTAARSWEAMVGARVAWLFGGILLLLPMILAAIVLSAVALGIFGPEVREQVWDVPFRAGAALIFLSVAAAIYRLRAGLES